jgi:hypothetical protein
MLKPVLFQNKTGFLVLNVYAFSVKEIGIV